MRLRLLVPLAALLAFSVAPAAAQSPEDPDVPTQGALQVVEDGGRLVDLPLEHTDVKAEVTGALARVTVRQTFGNPFEEPIEAIYVFPLPHEAAVTDMLIEVGERRIVAEVKPREEARKIYEEAKEAGKTAGLLEQERPNIFTQSVANLLPGEKIHVEIRYVERLKHRRNRYRFVFPMVVGPRYVPGGVADADRITPPILPPSLRSGHDISLSVDVEAGLPIRGARSESHAIEIAEREGGGAVVRIAERDAIPNKDFILSYSLTGEAPEVAVLAHRSDVGGYFTLRVEPPAEVDDEVVVPRELVFVVDCSGSMSGMPIETAKRVILESLEGMNPDDTFKILRFSESASSFSPKALANTPPAVSRARQYVKAMSGSGGTRMIEGIKAALSGEPGEGRMRIVFFLTDGYIGNEGQILAAIRELRNEARIFPLGVGSSVNRYLIDEMALAGRGEARYIRHDAKPEKIDEEVEAFYERVAKPFLTDLEVDWAGLPVADLYPRVIPDLFAGQPVDLVGRYTGPGEAEVVLRGRLGGGPWERTITVALPEAEEANGVLAPVWARARIADLSRKLDGKADPEIEKEITNLAVEFHLMSRFTSFVAVDERIVVDPDGTRRTVRQPLPIPEGTEYEGFKGKSGGYLGRSFGGGAAVGGSAAGPGAPTPGAMPRASGAGPAEPRPDALEGLARLRFDALLSGQKKDGSFGSVRDTALTCLALTGGGVEPGRGESGKALAKALEHLAKEVQGDDLDATERALAALAISEGYAWSRDEKAKPVVEKLVAWIVSERKPASVEAELFGLAALTSAARAGIALPDGAVDAAHARVAAGKSLLHLLIAAKLAGKVLPTGTYEVLKDIGRSGTRAMDFYLGTVAARIEGGKILEMWEPKARKFLKSAPKTNPLTHLVAGALTGEPRAPLIDW